MPSYHHGNLREALVEKGIEYVSNNGEATLSLRKISTACGVSHAAAYSHFKDKDALLDAMRDHVTAQFTEVLARAAELNREKPNLVMYIGKSYVEFFTKNPHYFKFLFKHVHTTVNLDDLTYSENYSPFEVFKTNAVAKFTQMGLPPEEHLRPLLIMWATVHGIASIATMEMVRYSGDWLALTESILMAYSQKGEK